MFRSRLVLISTIGSLLVLGACDAHTPSSLPATAISEPQTAGAQSDTPPATETVLHSFGGPDGAGPPAGVIADGKGGFFGATIFGGTRGNGTVFQIKPKGDGTYTETVLYSITGGSDGYRPVGGVAMDAHGALYVSPLGGGNAGCFAGCGTVEKLTPGPKGYTETTIYRFNPSPDANQPVGTPVVDSSGAIYGVAQSGGLTGNGAVFELAPSKSGYTESVIYSLPGGAGGYAPQSGLSIDAHGNIYGEATSGGLQNRRCSGGCGVIFELERSGSTFTPLTIYRFDGADGDYPDAPVTPDSATGVIYGTTQYGGVWVDGVVFALVPSHGTYSETVIHAVPKGVQSGVFMSPMLLTKSGTLYGTTFLRGRRMQRLRLRGDFPGNEERYGLHVRHRVSLRQPAQRRRYGKYDTDSRCARCDLWNDAVGRNANRML